MSKVTLSHEEGKQVLNKLKEDLFRPLKNHKGFQLWALFLALMLMLFAYAYFIQLRDGLGVTAMRDYVSWGAYIANFVFFIAVALIGMLISAVLGLLNIEWIKPISRIAEIIAVSMAAVAGLVIVFDMGRPDRLHHVFLYGRFQSPIFWDVTVVTTYTAISALLLLIPMIPDAAIMKNSLTGLPKWQMKIYELLSLNFKGTKEQYQLLHKGMRILLITIIPVAFAIHTVTSWLFASSLRYGWDSSVFGPYFVSGAFVAGSAAVIIAMYFFRKNYGLKDYLTDFHFDKMNRLLVLTSLVYLYFNINEFLVPGYKMKTGDAIHLAQLFTGHFGIMFWLVQIFGLILPILLLLFKEMRKPLPSMLIAIFVLLGAWFKRYLIVIPTQLHPHLPIQNVPEEFTTYIPTGVEIFVILGPMILALIIGTILAKIFPIMPIWEVAESKGVSIETINKEFESEKK
jgi:molybdopterin-containing oxidoreductase family membrane subunit